jgi:hypothetical protein
VQTGREREHFERDTKEVDWEALARAESLHGQRQDTEQQKTFANPVFGSWFGGFQKSLAYYSYKVP